MSEPTATVSAPRGRIYRALGVGERSGNKLPDPAILFLLLMLVVWGASWLLAGASFSDGSIRATASRLRSGACSMVPR